MLCNGKCREKRPDADDNEMQTLSVHRERGKPETEMLDAGGGDAIKCAENGLHGVRGHRTSKSTDQ